MFLSEVNPSADYPEFGSFKISDMKYKDSLLYILGAEGHILVYNHTGEKKFTKGSTVFSL